MYTIWSSTHTVLASLTNALSTDALDIFYKTVFQPQILLIAVDTNILRPSHLHLTLLLGWELSSIFVNFILVPAGRFFVIYCTIR